MDGILSNSAKQLDQGEFFISEKSVLESVKGKPLFYPYSEMALMLPQYFVYGAFFLKKCFSDIIDSGHCQHPPYLPLRVWSH